MERPRPPFRPARAWSPEHTTTRTAAFPASYDERSAIADGRREQVLNYRTGPHRGADIAVWVDRADRWPDTPVMHRSNDGSPVPGDAPENAHTQPGQGAAASEPPRERVDGSALQSRIDELEARIAAAPTSDAHVSALRSGIRALVSELVRRRQEAENTCRTLTQVLGATSDAFVALDANGRVTYVNEPAARLFRHEAEPLVGKNLWAELAEGVGQPLRAAYDWAVAEQRPLKVEAYSPTFGRWFENRLFPHAGGVVISFQDITERRLADERLRASEVRFRALYEQAAIGIAMTDLAGRLIHANPILCEMLGFSEAELRGLHLEDLTHPDDRAALAEHMARVLAGEALASSLEKRCVRKDGSTLWARITASVIRDEAGAPEYCLLLIEDVSERVQAEHALRESEARFARIAGHVPGIIFQLVQRADGSLELPYVSPGAVELLGMTPEELEAHAASWPGLVHPSDRVEWERSVAASAAALSDWRWTGRIVLPNGEERWLEGASRPARQADGGVVWDGMLIDVTERRRAEQQLEQSEQRFRSLFDFHPDAVYLLDANGFFVSANPACEEMSGYPPDELKGRSFAPLIVPEQVETAIAFFRGALQGKARHLTTAIRHKSGRRVEIDVTNVPVMEGDRVTGVFGIARDLTPQRRLEAQLRQAQKMEAVGRLAGGVAHDFNNLLTVITSCARFVADRVRADPVARGDVDELLNAAGRAAELTKQLLAFGRQQMLQPRWLDLNTKVTQVAGMLRRVIGEDIAIMTELAPTLWPVVADPGQLEQVIMNLAVNARDAMPNGGTLHLRTANVIIDQAAAQAYPGLEPGRYVSLVVEDTGTGIDPAILPNIFEPFVTTKGVGLGTGLGLAMVYGIVEQSGGHIYADSTPGEGSRFTVFLPSASTPAPARPGAVTATLTPGGHEAILLVEDDAAVRGVVRRMLQAQGYVVIDASNGAEALRLMEAREGRIDLLLLDVVMPGQSGRALADEISARWPGSRFIFMSGYTDDEMLRRGLTGPGLSFLAKPFTPDRLARAVRSALDDVPSQETELE